MPDVNYSSTLPTQVTTNFTGNQSVGPGASSEPVSSGGLTIKQLNLKHSHYDEMSDHWGKLAIMNAGDPLMKKNATEFLARRPRELQEIYQARVDRFTYRNVLGTCMGWYRSALFKNEPTVVGHPAIGTNHKLAKPDVEVPLAKPLEEYYARFRKNCDKTGTSYINIWREIFTSVALFEDGYLLLETLTTPSDAISLQDQKKAGVLGPDGKPDVYLVPYSPLAIFNWGDDEQGNLEWVCVAQTNVIHRFAQDPQVVDTWTYYDKMEFKKYQYVRRAGELSVSKVDENSIAELVAQGRHCLSGEAVPLFRFTVPESLVLGNKIFSPVLDYLNHDNGYAWALMMGNLAMPVITSDADIKPTMSEAGFIKLPVGSTYGWTEPKGLTFQRSEARLIELREDIYRLMHLTYQGRSSSATADGASGTAKEMEMMPAQDVLNEYGDLIIAFMQSTLDWVSVARKDAVKWDVRGMKFGKTITLEQVQKNEAVLALGVPSDTFRKEIYRGIAAENVPDANPETLTKIEQEIASSPSMAQITQQMAVARQTQFDSATIKEAQSYATPPPEAVAKKPTQLSRPSTTSFE